MPANNVKDKWFHGAASRAQVEQLVKKAGSNGSFAIRTSESVAGAYTISLLNKGRVFTYRVLPTEGKYAVETNVGVQKKTFISIDELVQEYKKPDNGLACGLTNPVGQEKPALPNRNPMVLRPLPPIPPNASSVVPSAPSAPTLALPPKPVTPYVRASYTGQSPNTNFNPVGIAAVAGRMSATLPPRHSNSCAGDSQGSTLPMTSPIPIRIQSDSPAPQNIAPSSAVEQSMMETSNSCIICYDAKFSAFFQPCGHVCCCMDCSKKLKECPLCRKKITKTQRAFVS